MTQFTLLPHQVPPPGDWAVHQFIGDRGEGSTFAGAHWLSHRVETGDTSLFIIAPSEQHLYDVMLTALREQNPLVVYRRSARSMFIENAQVKIFIEPHPFEFKGHRFHAGWADHAARIKNAGVVLHEAKMCLRLGDTRPPQMVLSGSEAYPTEGAVSYGNTDTNIHLPARYRDSLNATK